MADRFFRLVRSRDHLVNQLGKFARKGTQFKVLSLGVNSSTSASKLILQIFAALAEYDWESILGRTRAEQLLANAKGKHIDLPAGLDVEKSAKVKKALERGLFVAEIVSLTDISMSSVKRGIENGLKKRLCKCHLGKRRIMYSPQNYPQLVEVCRPEQLTNSKTLN